jgi:hypothetical protein
MRCVTGSVGLAFTLGLVALSIEAAGWVVEQVAQWRGPDGALGEPQVVASVFRVCEGRVCSVVRYTDFEAALRAAGLA